jgi:hypothetical protein
VEPEKQPLLASGSETTFASRQRPRKDNGTAAWGRLGEHVPAATDTRMNGVVYAGRAEEL